MDVFQLMTTIVTVAMFVAANHRSYLNRFATNADLDKKTCKPSDILFEIENISILHCSFKCQITSRCAGISYNVEEKSCTGCGKQYLPLIFDPADFLNKTGNKYYKGDWTNYGGMLYTYYIYPENFSTAVNYCLDRHGFLARIDSETKQTFLNESCSGHSTWISLTDEGHSNIWKWLNDNSTATFTNWHSGMPDEDELNNCVLADSTYVYEWISHRCYISIGPALCERELN